VIASRSRAVAEGMRVFGLVPMGRHVTVRPAPHAVGFVDAAAHRAELAPVYNRYRPVGDERDDAALVMRPLFGTSVVLDVLLSEANFFGAATVVLTSASSKTAFGLAQLLRPRPVGSVGLTSAARRPWVEGLGLYDAVLAYGELGHLKAADGAVLVDFAGDRALIRGAQERLGGALRRSLQVGFTHHGAGVDEAPLSGPIPELFFAPTEIARRGRDFALRYTEARRDFTAVAKPALRIAHVTDRDALMRVYRQLLGGHADPAVGYVASL
jgi:Protein of unknown function (DUF2855)